MPTISDKINYDGEETMSCSFSENYGNTGISYDRVSELKSVTEENKRNIAETIDKINTLERKTSVEMNELKNINMITHNEMIKKYTKIEEFIAIISVINLLLHIFL